MPAANASVVASGLVKRFAAKDGPVTALAGLDLEVPEGTVLGLLGPNGAGKTTAVSILTTLLEPDEGHATVAGVDLRRNPQEVRRRIGLSGQYAAVDEVLTGRENLEMVGRLYHLGRRHSRQRAVDLLERFGLTDAGDRQAKTYSGGMRRRLDILAGTIVRPAVLFLDEPTTGLDPRSRNEIYEHLSESVDAGTTVILTTQYLDEAERLADDITILDGGRVVTTGTPDELTAAVGTGLDVVVTAAHRDRARAVLAGLGARHVGTAPGPEDSLRLSFGLDDEPHLPTVLRALDDDDVDVRDIGRRRASLDEAFLALTGHPTERTQP